MLSRKNSFLLIRPICEYFVKTTQYKTSPSIINWSKKLSTMSDSEEKKAELKKRLTPLQYHVTQEKGTERQVTAFTIHS
ncbi:hypothetical protein J6590_072995 [Homalodisca vitripennis]|nr:hypothetical protein J6590_072995 [Homalodisca vitripennis]